MSRNIIWRFEMARKKVAAKRPAKPQLPVDDEGQVTPHSDALTENEASGALVGLSSADIASALRTGGVGSYTRDSAFKDTDVGMDEFLRYCLATQAGSITSLTSVLNSVQATKAQDNATLANFENNANSFFGMISKSGTVFHNNLLQSYGLETDNEVLSTAALTKLIDGLLEERLAAFAANAK
jgi:hypothetical protein